MPTIVEIVEQTIILLSEDGNYQLCRREKHLDSTKFHYSKMRYGDILKLRRKILDHFGVNGK